MFAITVTLAAAVRIISDIGSPAAGEVGVQAPEQNHDPNLEINSSFHLRLKQLRFRRGRNDVDSEGLGGASAYGLNLSAYGYFGLRPEPMRVRTHLIISCLATRSDLLRK